VLLRLVEGLRLLLVVLLKQVVVLLAVVGVFPTWAVKLECNKQLV
jgi:hypothetical protein